MLTSSAAAQQACPGYRYRSQPDMPPMPIDPAPWMEVTQDTDGSFWIEDVQAHLMLSQEFGFMNTGIIPSNDFDRYCRVYGVQTNHVVSFAMYNGDPWFPVGYWGDTPNDFTAPFPILLASWIEVYYDAPGPLTNALTFCVSGQYTNGDYFPTLTNTVNLATGANHLVVWPTWTYPDNTNSSPTLSLEVTADDCTPHSGQDQGPAPLDAASTYGCGLYLSISQTNTNSVLLTIHNSVGGRSYTIWSSQDLSIPLTNWVADTNLLGASGDTTPVLIVKNGRPDLFFRASEVRDYVTNIVTTNGLAFVDTGTDPPDTMGAVGPNHFVELLNWGQDPLATGSVRVYDKLGTIVAETNSAEFFRVDTNTPRGILVVDGRILYDWQAHRWVAIALEDGAARVLLAVSKSDSPLPLVSGWTNRALDFSGIGSFTDFPTLGLDSNGIYVTALQVGDSTNRAHTVIAIKKPDVYTNSWVTNRFDIYTSNTVPIWTIQPAVNFDNVATNGCAWFVAKGMPNLAPTYQGGAIFYRRLAWNGNAASWAENDWIAVTNGANYRDYYDLDGTNGLNLEGGVGSRLAMTVIRNGSLWTCHEVGLGTNGTYTGDASGSTKDRSGIQWLRFAVDPSGGSLDYLAHGRFYDETLGDPHSFTMPSLMVNCAGDMVAAFSGYNSSNYLGAYYCARLVGGEAFNIPRLIQPGMTSYTTITRLGDYSATTLDPFDDWTFWTVQEYADPEGDPNGGRPWRTVIAKIKPR